MGIVIFVMGAVVAVFVSMLVGGLMLPARHTTTRTVRLLATPEAVWSLIADPAGYAVWQDAISSVDVEGRSPLRWREYGDDGATALEASTVHAPHRFSAHSLDNDTHRNLERAFVLEPDDGGTRVVYTEHISVSNPIARFFFRYVRNRNAAIDRLLAEIANALDERALPSNPINS